MVFKIGDKVKRITNFHTFFQVFKPEETYIVLALRKTPGEKTETMVLRDSTGKSLAGTYNPRYFIKVENASSRNLPDWW